MRRWFIFWLLCTVTCLAHPGGLDKQGGHFNHKTGQYHDHQAAQPDQDSGISLPESTRETRIRSYFEAANTGVSFVGRVKRDVSGSQRKRVLARDGHQCVVCASTTRLEVDHRRALMNGGDNSLANLATLCDDCHTIKTRWTTG